MLRTFRIGGIHPPENKLSAGKKITALAAPKQVIIPLSQHIGAPAQAVVKKGDLVKVGPYLQKPEVSFRQIFTLLFPAKSTRLTMLWIQVVTDVLPFILTWRAMNGKSPLIVLTHW